MPIIQLADSALSYAGQAASVATSGLQQDQARMMQLARDQEQSALQRARMAQDEEQYRVRNALAFEQMDQRRDAQRVEQLDRIGKEWTRGLELAEKVGVQPTFENLVRMDREIAGANPELHARLNELWPLPASADDPAFAPSFGRRAEVVQQVRGIEARQVKDVLWADIQSRAEEAGLTPQELADLEEVYLADSTDREFAAAVDGVITGAEGRAVEEFTIEEARKSISRNADKLIKLVTGDKADATLRSAMGRLIRGTSKDPGMDAFVVNIYANGDADYLTKEVAAAIEQGRALGMREAVGRGAPPPAQAPPAGSVPPSGAPAAPAPEPTAPGGAPPVVSRRNAPVLSQTFAAPKQSAEAKTVRQFFEAEGIGPKSTPAEVRRGFATFIDMKLPEIGVNVQGKATQAFYAQVYDRYRESQDPTERAIAYAASYLKNNR